LSCYISPSQPSRSPPVPKLQDYIPSLCWPFLLRLCRCERQRTCVPRGHTPVCRDSWCVRSTYQDDRGLPRWLIQKTDAFFDNVCELDLVFNFYKVRSDFLTIRANADPVADIRFMPFWTKYFWQERLKKRAKMWSCPDWRLWRSWSDIVLVAYLSTRCSALFACSDFMVYIPYFSRLSYQYAFQWPRPHLRPSLASRGR
jgi:hypothetical protein